MVNLQGYDVNIVHIVGNKNPTDYFTRQAWNNDQKLSQHIKCVDSEVVNQVRVQRMQVTRRYKQL